MLQHWASQRCWAIFSCLLFIAAKCQLVQTQGTIIRQLNRRFGELDSSLVDRIKTLNIEKLDNLADALLDFSNINDLGTWLNSNQD
ncbi:MAG: DUF4351 domain-containing protein [Aphanizomenon flos-aquae KM1D3_PB]|uniref:DUF4351 domain-containing protein n=1 Tax=Aphanizomenon flos-aquae TaxID=1176 RepID=UPI0009DF1385|nr:MAG: DUF4351 domain-containing protein [Aphanizomenon flos-aquae KM1D3_PB]